jgi:hypothetical protein
MNPTGTITTDPHVLRSLDQPPASTLANALAPTVRAWAKPKGSPSHVLDGRERATQALKLIAAATKALARRRGPREDAARQWLDSSASAITNAMTAFDTLGAECEGPAALALVERLAQVRAQRDSAQMALDAAESTATMRAAREALDDAAVSMRAFDRELRALIAAATLPRLPDPRAFADAEQQTIELARAAKQGRRPATTLGIAIEMGARAAAPSDDPGAVVRATLAARLWTCWENESAAAELYRWRHARYLEGRPLPAPAAEAPDDPLALSFDQAKKLATLDTDAKAIASLSWQSLTDEQVRELARANLLRSEQRTEYEARNHV